MLSLLPLLAATAGATEIGESRPFGLGIQLGQPTGISGKIYLGGRRNAIDFTAGGGGYGGGYGGYYWAGFYGQVAYHWHVTELTSGNGVAIPFRVGVGGFITTGGWGYYGWGRDRYYNTVVGARVPFGLDFDLEEAPVQFWIEAAVDVTLVGIGYDGGIGARYYF
jgi:hypothetical protein